MLLDFTKTFEVHTDVFDFGIWEFLMHDKHYTVFECHKLNWTEGFTPCKRKKWFTIVIAFTYGDIT